MLRTLPPEIAAEANRARERSVRHYRYNPPMDPFSSPLGRGNRVNPLDHLLSRNNQADDKYEDRDPIVSEESISGMLLFDVVSCNQLIQSFRPGLDALFSATIRERHPFEVVFQYCSFSINIQDTAIIFHEYSLCLLFAQASR